MAVKPSPKPAPAEHTTEPAESFRARRWAVGTNVAVMVVLALVLFGFVQYVGFKFGSQIQADMTSHGVNSLRDGTKTLVRGVETSVTLTSLYHTTDMDEENQKFLRAVNDLFSLYQGVNRSKVETKAINPLKDHNERSELIKRLRNKKKYVDETVKHQEVIKYFSEEAYPKLKTLLEDELARLEEVITQSPVFASLPQVENIRRGYTSLPTQADELIQAIGPALEEDIPLYSTVVRDIRTFITQTGGARSFLQSISNWGEQVVVRQPDLSNVARAYLTGTKVRFRETLDALGEVDTLSQDLPTLKLDELAREIRQSNTIVVETDEDARVLSFGEVWPRKQQGGFSVQSKFEDHYFAGEAHVTSAILQMTKTEKPAAIFIKFGGPPVFVAGGGMNPFMQQQRQPAQYPVMKRALERLNFTVEEWDVQASKEAPTIDPPPSKTVYVVLRPVSQQPQMMPGMPQMPQGRFDDASRQAVLSAIKDSGRALFLAGWVQPAGPFPIAAPYEYSDYLKNDWGLNVRHDVVTLSFINFEPGKWAFRRPTPVGLSDFDFGDHIIAENVQGQPGLFPSATPVERTETPPDDVQVEDLVTVRSSDDIWGETDVMGLQSELQRLNYSTGAGDTDVRGPFPVAVAATKGEQKMVVVSSDGFAQDRVTGQQVMRLGASGIILQKGNPANEPFFVNCVQWLADNEDQMGLGAVTEFAESRLSIKEGGTLVAWQWFATAGMPALVLLCGAGVWFVHRR